MNVLVKDNLGEVLILLNNGYKVLAGSTNVLVNVKKGLEKKENFVDITSLKELKGITFSEDGLTLGSLTTFSELEQALKDNKEYKCLFDCAFNMGGPQIRNRATLGGNICDASPACDLGAPLLSLNAKLYAVSIEGEREIDIKDFFISNKKTTLKENELLEKIFIPKSNGSNGYIKVGLRNAMAISIVSFAYSKNNGKLSLAMGSVLSKPTRLLNVEKYLEKNTTLSYTEIIKELYKDISPITDLRASSKYRYEVAKNLLIDTLEKEFNYDFI